MNGERWGVRWRGKWSPGVCFLSGREETNSRLYTDGNNPVGRKNMMTPQREERVGKRTSPGGQEGMAFVHVEGFVLGRSIHGHL